MIKSTLGVSGMEIYIEFTMKPNDSRINVVARYSVDFLMKFGNLYATLRLQAPGLYNV